MLVKKLLIILYLIKIFIAAKIYTCGNGMVPLKFSEIAFFETTNFPKLLNSGDGCDFTFVLSNQKTIISKMFATFIQITSDSTDLTFLAAESNSFKIQDYFNSFFIADQGNIIFEENFEGCPLDSISRRKPFIFENDKQIIYLRSNYFENQSRNCSCLWQFGAPKGYGFKIVFQNFNVSSQTLLRMRNTTDLLVNEKNAKLDHPYYNNDNYLQINLTKGDPNFVTKMEFQFYISIVKKTEEKMDGNCSVLQTDTVITWTNINNNKNAGYKENVQCRFDLIVPKYKVVIVNFKIFSLEENVDYISYNEGGENNDVFLSQISTDNFVLEPYENGTDKRISFKFVSDGNIQLLGFNIEFEYISCHCENHLAKCDSISNVLMNFTTDGAFFCENLRCNITIESCPTKLTLFQINFNNYIERYDTFRIISNNQIVLDLQRHQQDTFYVFLNSENTNIFQAITFSTSFENEMFFDINSVDPEPEIDLQIMLSEDVPNAIIDTGISSFTTVNMSTFLYSKNVTFILYSIDPTTLVLYNNKSLTTVLNYCFFKNSPNKCIIKDNGFVIYSQLYASISGIFAVRLSTGSKGCILNENIFLSNKLSFFPVSAIATENDSCALTVLLDNKRTFYIISHLWTTVKKENVKVFVGIDQTRLIFEFNSKTSKKWKDVVLESAVYTILVPKTAAVYFIFKEVSFNETISISQYSYQSMIATPAYGTSKRSSYYGIFMTYQVKEYPIKFVVLDFFLSEQSNFYFLVDDNIINVNKIGDYVIFQNQNVTLKYFDIEGLLENGALFFIESFDPKLNI